MQFSFFGALGSILASSGFASFAEDPRSLIMIIIACVLLYMGIGKKFEPLLLVPIAFGMLLANLPLTGLLNAPVDGSSPGMLWVFYQGVQHAIYPSIIFLGIGAMTDFGPLIARPSSLLLGAAAQLGIFSAFLLALVLGFPGKVAAAIAIIGGADGPTSILVASRLAADYLPAIAIAAYSYMALIPLIQPPIMRLLTTKKEREVKMEQLRQVSKTEKIVFPIAVAIIVILLIPDTAPLIGMLMLGNLLRECGVTDRLSDTAQNALCNIVTIFLGLSVGCKAIASTFLTWETIKIIILGLIAFTFSTVGGLLFGKVMYKSQFILILDLHKFFSRFFIFHKWFQFFHLLQICDPSFSDMSCNPVSEKRITMQQETSLSNTVCLIVKFLRHHLIEIFQFLMF